MQYTGDWIYGQMQLKKNEEVMSYSVVDDEGSAHTLFGTAILNLVAGDQVNPFNCMMQIQYTYVV